MELHYEAFTVNSAPTQQLIVYQAEPGSTSADALALLGSLSAAPCPRRTPRRAPTEAGRPGRSRPGASWVCQDQDHDAAPGRTRGRMTP
ncbi:hypothetical protein ABT088_08170 [Streptomyces mirabilis]